MHFRTGARGHPSPQYLWIKGLRTLEIHHQITNAFWSETQPISIKSARSSWCSAGTKVAPKTTRSFSLQTCSSFIICSQLILSTNSFWTWWFISNCCHQSSWISMPFSPIFCLWNERPNSCKPFTTACLHTDGSKKWNKKELLNSDHDIN